MYKNFKEASYPNTYYRREMACITAALTMRRSVRVAGLSGMGKSNFLRFLVSHPQLIIKFPSIKIDSIHFLYIDCNRLNSVKTLSFYRECLFNLRVEQSIPTLTDEYLLYKQLELALISLDRQTPVVLVVDRAEALYENVGQEFFNQLRNLRDEAKAGQMMFIFGSQQPLGYLYELEKLFSATCWVGPLVDADRIHFFEQQEHRLGIKMGEVWRNILWRLTGAHPGLLKSGLEWLSHSKRKDNIGETLTDEKNLIRGLLGYEPIRRYCQRLWESLTETEQQFLTRLERSSTKNPSSNLIKSGVLVEYQDHWRIFSPLWQAYLSKFIWPQQWAKPIRIAANSTTRQVTLHWQGQTATVVIKRSLVFKLLQVFANAPGEVLHKNKLIEALYPDEEGEGISDDALFQLVTALRKLLDPLVKSLCPEMTTTCIENVRGVGYRLVLDCSDFQKLDQGPGAQIGNDTVGELF